MMIEGMVSHQSMVQPVPPRLPRLKRPQTASRVSRPCSNRVPGCVARWGQLQRSACTGKQACQDLPWREWPQSPAWHAGTADGNAGMEAQIALGSSPKRSVQHAVRTDGKNAATSNHGLCRAGYPAGGGRSAQESPESALVPLDGEAHEPKNTSMGTLCFQ